MKTTLHHLTSVSVLQAAIAFCCFLLGLFYCIPSNAQEWRYSPEVNRAQLEAGFIGGEGGQWPQSLAVSSDASLLMMGTDVAGLIRSENQGELWEQANAGYTPRGSARHRHRS